MAEKIQLRRDTATNWASSNPVLSQGEMGYVTDTKDFKFGDDTTAWSSLTPWSPNAITGASKLVSIGSNGFGTSVNTVSTSTAGTSEIMFTVGVASTNITALWNHFYTTTSGTIPDTDPAGAITFSASLKVVSSTNPGTVTGTLYRMTFNGRTSVTLDPGGRITADILGVSLATGDVVAIRTYLASGTAYAPRTTWGTYGANLGGFTSTTDLTAPGSAAITGSTGNYYGPHVLLGYPTGANNAKSVLVLGDSIGFGTGDFGSATTRLGMWAGFAARALSGVAGIVNIAIPSDNSQYFLNTNGSFRRLSAAQRCNSAIIEYGTNDLVYLSSTAAQVETNNVNIANTLRRLGIAKIFLTTLTPFATSSDGWITTTNQAPVSSEAQRVAYNTWARAGCPVDPTTKAPVAVGTSGALLAGSYGHPITGVFDTAATVESSLNSGKWATPNRVVTGSITSGTFALTSSTANFQTANQEAGGDLGSAVMLAGAGAAGARLSGFISAISSSTAATLDAFAGAAAGTTVTNAVLGVGVMTPDGIHPSPRGHYLMAQAINTALL